MYSKANYLFIPTPLFFGFVSIIAQHFLIVKGEIIMPTQINFGDYEYQFVGTAIGRPPDILHYNKDCQRQPLQFLSYIRPIILKIDFRAYRYIKREYTSAETAEVYM